MQTEQNTENDFSQVLIGPRIRKIDRLNTENTSTIKTALAVSFYRDVFRKATRETHLDRQGRSLGKDVSVYMTSLHTARCRQDPKLWRRVSSYMRLQFVVTRKTATPHRRCNQWYFKGRKKRPPIQQCTIS